MKLKVNSKETEAKDGCTIAELASQLALPERSCRHFALLEFRFQPRTSNRLYFSGKKH